MFGNAFVGQSLTQSFSRTATASPPTNPFERTIVRQGLGKQDDSLYLHERWEEPITSDVKYDYATVIMTAFYFGGLLVLIILLILIPLSRKPLAETRDGLSTLRYSNVAKLFSICNLSFWLVIGYEVISQAKHKDLISAIGIAAFPNLMALYFLIDLCLWKVQFDGEKVYVFSPWKKPRNFSWSEIVPGSHRRLSRGHVFAVRNQGELVIRHGLSGALSFAQEAINRQLLKSPDAS